MSYIFFTNPVSVKFSNKLPLYNIKIPLFTNNSLVYYKNNSLNSCGVGSNTNSRYKSRRT
jgi:hypothetical protein